VNQTNAPVNNAVENIKANGIGDRSPEEIFTAISEHESLLRYRLIIERNVSDFSDLGANINTRRARCER
jgi:hypothetical protein